MILEKLFLKKIIIFFNYFKIIIYGISIKMTEENKELSNNFYELLKLPVAKDRINRLKEIINKKKKNITKKKRNEIYKLNALIKEKQEQMKMQNEQMRIKEEQQKQQQQQHKTSINKIKSYSNNKGKMLLISDLEGCAKYNSTGSVIQSQYMCSNYFFNDLKKFLNNNKNNKIAFLGDYFDKGPLFRESIENIKELHENYNENNRVYIILGNRDINKLRLFDEVNNLIHNINDISKKCRDSMQKSFGFSLLNIYVLKLLLNDNSFDHDIKLNIVINVLFFNTMGINIKDLKYNKKDNEHDRNEKIKKLTNLQKSYETVKKEIRNMNININNYSNNNTGINTNFNLSIKKKLINNIRKEYVNCYKDMVVIEYDLTNFFKNVLKEDNNKDKTNFNYIIGNGKIINYDHNFKIFLSHSGGIGTFPLHNIKYYTRIMENIIFKDMNNYYIDIENTRNNLMNIPINDELDIDKDINKLIETINSPLVHRYDNNILLQALGLKPNNVNKFDQSPFVSFIQSCNINSCYGPYSKTFKMFENNDLKKNLLIAKNLGIKFVAFGHSPMCTPVPLIFRRKESSLIFISCDISNGYRKLLSYKKKNNSNELKNGYIYPPLPISCISKRKIDGKSEYKVGIKYFDENSLTNYNISHQDNKNVYLRQFAPMLGNWDLYSVPLFRDFTKRNGDGTYNIVYPKTGKSLHFDAYGRPNNVKSKGPPQAFQPARIIPTNPKNIDTMCKIIQNYTNKEEEASLEI